MLRFIRIGGTVLIGTVATMLAAWMVLIPSLALAQSERESAARALVLETLATSRAADIYADARKYLHAVGVPIAQDMLSGKLSVPQIRDQLARDYMMESLKLNVLVDKSADGIEASFLTHRDEIVNDLAVILAKHLSPDEIEAMREMARLEAIKKLFNMYYTIIHSAFNKTPEEARAMMPFGAWVQEMMTQYLERGKKPESTAPSAERIAKAMAITNEGWTTARFDDLVAASMHVARLFVTSFTPEDKKAEALAGMDNFKETYPTMKIMWSTMASTWLAGMLTEEQLVQLQGFMHEPAVAKTSEIFIEMQRSLLAITQSDADAVRDYMMATIAKGLPTQHSAEELAAFQADLKAYADKWGPKLTETLPPETRDPLTQSISRVVELYLAQLNRLEGKQP